MKYQRVVEMKEQQKQCFEQRLEQIQMELDREVQLTKTLGKQLDGLTEAHSQTLVQLESTKQQLSIASQRAEKLANALRSVSKEIEERNEFQIDELRTQKDVIVSENKKLARALEEIKDLNLQLEQMLQKSEEMKKHLEEKLKIQKVCEQGRIEVAFLLFSFQKLI